MAAAARTARWWARRVRSVRVAWTAAADGETFKAMAARAAADFDGVVNAALAAYQGLRLPGERPDAAAAGHGQAWRSVCRVEGDPRARAHRRDVHRRPARADPHRQFHLLRVRLAARGEPQRGGGDGIGAHRAGVHDPQDDV